MRLLISAILFLLIIQLVSAQTVSLSVEIEYTDKSTNTSSVPIEYTIHYLENEKTSRGTVLLDDSNLFSADVFPGFINLRVSVDDTETEGYDFFGENTFFVNQSKNISVVLFPVGSARILVVDENNHPIEAPVRIDCSRSNGVQGYFTTDKFGVVKTEFLPVGKCVFRSAVDNVVINKSIEITRGSKKEVILELEGYSSRKNSYSWVWVAAIAIVAVVGFSIRKMKTKGRSEKKENKPAEVVISSGKEDIMTALNKKEKHVVQFLLEEAKKAGADGKHTKNFYVSQANLVRGADIPKTSLARVLESLTNKSILSVEKIGKLKKISLTEWFNSK